MNRKKLQLGLIFGIFLVAYNIVVFLVAEKFHTSFWISFIFVLLAFLFMAFAFFFVSDEKRKKQVVGMPITVLTTMYYVIELIMGTIFMFFDVSFVAVFLPQFLLFVLFVVCFIPAVLSENNYKSTEQKTDNVSTETKETNEEK